jgi:arylsulfatase
VISEQSTGYPGYDSIITRDKATIGRMMKDNGYRTSWFGKDHNVPAFQASQDGPFDQWPIGMGFEYFYGFIGGDTNQWQPNLFRNTTQIYPFVGKPGWNLTTGMADDAIAYLNRINALAPEQPFFLKYAPGGVHAPHHPTPRWNSPTRPRAAQQRGAAFERRFCARRGLLPGRSPCAWKSPSAARTAPQWRCRC